MKIASNLFLIKKTLKAKLYEKGGLKEWLPNAAIIDCKYSHQNKSYDIIIEDWFKEKSILFAHITLGDLLNNKHTPKVELTTGIAISEFPEDLVKVQEEAVDFSVKIKRSLVWLWTGCGKTKAGIEIANALFSFGKIKRLIWITPPMAREQIKSQFERWLNTGIIYEIVSVNFFSYNKRTDLTEDDLIIIDECHRTKNGIVVNKLQSPDCRLAENIRISITTAGYAHGLTATSCLNGDLDLFGIFHTLHKKIVVPEDTTVNQQLKIKNGEAIGIKSVFNFVSNISPYIFHRKKSNYDSRYVIDKSMDVFLSKEQSARMNELYQRVGSPIKKRNEKSIVEAYTRMIECAYRVGGDKIKSEALQKIIESIPHDEQIIIFGFTVNSAYSDIALIRQSCSESNHSFIELHGGRIDTDNQLAIHLFREKKYRILIASYGCGAEMLDFPNANHVIIYGHSLNPIHRYQGIGRIDRLSQKKQAYSYTITLQNSVEGYINNIYNRKVEHHKELSDYFNNNINEILNNEIP